MSRTTGKVPGSIFEKPGSFAATSYAGRDAKCEFPSAPHLSHQRGSPLKCRFQPVGGAQRRDMINTYENLYSQARFLAGHDWVVGLEDESNLTLDILNMLQPQKETTPYSPCVTSAIKLLFILPMFEEGGCTQISTSMLSVRVPEMARNRGRTSQWLRFVSTPPTPVLVRKSIVV